MNAKLEQPNGMTETLVPRFNIPLRDSWLFWSCNSLHSPAIIVFLLSGPRPLQVLKFQRVKAIKASDEMEHNETATGPPNIQPLT